MKRRKEEKRKYGREEEAIIIIERTDEVRQGDGEWRGRRRRFIASVFGSGEA